MIVGSELTAVAGVDGGELLHSVEGRARSQRMVRQFVSIGAGLAATMAGNLLIVPMVYHHLGREAFGVWALFVSVQVMLAAVDPGNALIHHLTAVLAVDDRPRAARLVSASLAATIGVALTLVATFAVSSFFVDWAGVWNVGGTLAPDARAATAVLVLAVALGLPVALADKLNLARQRGGRNGALVAVAGIATLMTAVIVMHFGGGLPAVVAATTLPAVAIRLGWLLAIFATDERVRPAMALDGALRVLLRASGAFTILQACAVVSYTGDQFIVTRILGPLSVAQYAVPAKAFAILLAVTGASTTALWPAFLEAVARSDVRWVRAETRRLACWAAVIGVLFGLGLVVLGPRVLSVWVGAGYRPDRSLLLAFACWGLIYVVTNVLWFIVLSLGSLRRLVWLSVLSTLVNVGASVLLTRRIGVSGAVWGSVFSTLFVTAIPLFLILRSSIGGLSRAQASSS